MEVKLRKQQREIFGIMKANAGSFIRKHKKSLTALRVYWRLMSKEYNPIRNITQSGMKEFFDKGILTRIGDGEFSLRQDVELWQKKPKSKKHESAITA